MVYSARSAVHCPLLNDAVFPQRKYGAPFVLQTVNVRNDYVSNNFVVVTEIKCHLALTCDYVQVNKRIQFYFKILSDC